MLDRTPPIEGATKDKDRPRLTQASARSAKPEAARYDLKDATNGVAGLRLTVFPSGAKTWSLRYDVAGKDRRFTIGPYSENGITLDKARKLAADRLVAVKAGRDPAAEKAEERRKVAAGIDQGQMFATAWANWTDAPKPKSRNHKGWRTSTANRVTRLYDSRLEPIWGKRRLDEITKADVTTLTNPIAKKHPQSAARILSVLATFFAWCVAQGRIAKSPCDGIEKAKGNKRKRKLTDDELRWLWLACEREPYPMGYLVKLLLLTLARRTEGASMRDREIHKGNRRVWIIPPERAKNNREHAIFLTDAMLAILGAIPRVKNKAGYIFCTDGESSFSGYSKAKKRLDAAMLEIAREDDPEVVTIPNWTLHDLRRTGATRMQRLGFDTETVDGCLNHADDDAYQQHDYEDEKARAFDAWSRDLLRIVSPRT